MYYLHTVNGWYTYDRNWPYLPQCKGQTADQLGQDAFTACMATELGSNPGLAGWYTADERPVGQAERVFGQYSILRQSDPDGVTFIAQNKIRELTRWRDAVDVMGVDPYPIFNIPEGKRSPLQKVTGWVNWAQAAVYRSRPVWGVIQFFKFGANGHWPTYDELRTMSYMAVVAGAKGLFYWSYGAGALSLVKDPDLREEYWQRLVRVTEEIKSLEPALISPDAPHIITSYSPAESIRVLAKQVGDTRYIIAVNNTAEAGVTATFTLRDNAGQVEVVEEGRNLTLEGTVFSDVFDPYQVHVYRIGRPAEIVSNDNVALDATPSSVGPGDAVTVAVNSGPGGTTDWVGLYAVGAPDTSYLDWKYLNGLRAAPATGLTAATFTFPMPPTEGNYEFRFFPNNGLSPRLATSPTVTVLPPGDPS